MCLLIIAYVATSIIVGVTVSAALIFITIVVIVIRVRRRRTRATTLPAQLVYAGLQDDSVVIVSSDSLTSPRFYFNPLVSEAPPSYETVNS